MTVTQFRETGAELSNDLKHRHLLWRAWATDTYRVSTPRRHGHCTFVMLNPSTADGHDDDPTIRRCINFAHRWGYNRLEVVNLFDYRTKSPKTLMALNDADNPCSVDNQRFVQKAVENAGTVVCAWGAHGDWLGQDETVLGWMADVVKVPLECLGFTAGGQPRHPLYIHQDQPLVPMFG